MSSSPKTQAEQFSTYELHESSRDPNPGEITGIGSLPPADGGWAAWLFLFGSFLIEMLLWGFPFSFGVLNDYYSNHEPLASHPSGISAVGTTCSGIMYLGAPIFFALFQRYPRFCRTSPFFGLPIVVLAMALSSYATAVWHLILTQGILYALGGGLLYYPIFIFIDEWFIRRKGFAFGVMWAGSGCGGLSGPLVLNWGLSKYGAATFLRGWAIALLVLTGPILFFVKPRIPISRIHREPQAGLLVGFSFVKTRVFWVLQLGNVVQGLGYFIPALYLPSYARTLHLTPLQSSLLVSLLNTASVPGVVLLSAMCDRTNVTNVIFISAFGSTVSIFLLWGFSSSLPLLSVFAILYGFFAGGFTSTYAGVFRELRGISPGADLGSIAGLLSLGRGVGNVICGPISELLLRDGRGEKAPKFAYDSSYGTLIVFTGITAALTLTPWVVIDSITSTPFAGNPTPVFVLDDLVDWLPGSMMQVLARELQQSEICFVRRKPSPGPAHGDDASKAIEPHHYDIRWFTSHHEEPFCGHAVLAAALALNRRYPDKSAFRFGSSSGIVTHAEVVRPGTVVMEFPSVPVDQAMNADVETKSAFASALGISEAQILFLGANVLKDIVIEVDADVDFSVAAMDIDPIAMLQASPADTRSQVITSAGRKIGVAFVKRVFACGVERMIC